MTENNTTAEGDTYHESYWEVSPEYTQTVSRWGRMLTPLRVGSILSAHSFSVSDLVNDEHDPIVVGGVLPDRLDAAMLYAWLGY